MPFFDWYGGEGSSSQRKIILREIDRTNDTERGNFINNSSLLGKGRFSRVIRGKIKEASRLHSEPSLNLRDTNSKTTTDTTGSTDGEDFSPEMAVKAKTILIGYLKIFI